MNRFSSPVLTYIALSLVLLLAGYLRFVAVNDTVVLLPYRADAAHYFNYAYNLRHYGTYSWQFDSVAGTNDRPAPDAEVTPGYPLFLSAFTSTPPSADIFRRVELCQAFMGSVAVLLVFLLFRQIASPWQALVITLLAAISPQLVNIAVYMLSENLFILLLVAALYVFSRAIRDGRWFVPLMLAAGVMFGLAALTRPVLEYFLPCLMVMIYLAYARRPALKAAGMLVLGFSLVWAPWMVRNYITLGKIGDSRVMRATIHQGSYPDLMYKGNPDSRGYPYRFDPDYQRDSKDLGSVLKAVGEQWRDHPLTELKWYLIGKPVLLWSWKMVSGPGDIFIYAAIISPYLTNPLFASLHVVMYGLHGLLVILAFGFCFFVFMPAARRYYDSKRIFLLRVLSVLLLYNTAILMIGAPFTRYSTPFLPYAYGMGVLAACILGQYMYEARAKSREAYFARRR